MNRKQHAAFARLRQQIEQAIGQFVTECAEAGAPLPAPVPDTWSHELEGDNESQDSPGIYAEVTVCTTRRWDRVTISLT